MNTGRDERIDNFEYREEFSRDWGVYSNWLRPYNDAMRRWLSGIIIPTPETPDPIPVVYATPERAFATFTNPRIEGQIRLPVISFTLTGMTWDQSRFKPAFIEAQRVRIGNRWQLHNRAMPWELSYNITAWSKFYNVLDYISYVLLSRFTPKSYVNVGGIASELAFLGHSDNSELEPGADRDRVLRHDYQFKIEAWMQMPFKDVGSISSVWALVNNNNDTPTVEGTLADPAFVPKEVNVIAGTFELSDEEKQIRLTRSNQSASVNSGIIDTSQTEKHMQSPKVEIVEENTR